MKNAALSLKYHFLARSKLVAIPVEDVDTPEAPEVTIEANLLGESSLACVVAVAWGAEDVSPYYVAVELHSIFDFDTSGDPEFYQRLSPKARVTMLGVNAAQITYNAIRSHIAALTAMGPHRTRFLPTIVIEPSDVKLFASDDLAHLLEERPASKTVVTARKDAKPKLRSTRKSKG